MLIIHRETESFKKKELARSKDKHKTSGLKAFPVNHEKTSCIALLFDRIIKVIQCMLKCFTPHNHLQSNKSTPQINTMTKK